MAEIAELVKGGSLCITITLSRFSSGLRVSVKALPHVEDFFRNLAAGAQQSTTVFGRSWIDPQNKDRDLRVWAFPHPLNTINTGDQIPYTLERVGRPLLEQDLDGRYTGVLTNISFLRLVGISEGEGVVFGVKGVFSRPEVANIKGKLVDAMRKFYQDYLLPIDYVVQVSVQDGRF